MILDSLFLAGSPGMYVGIEQSYLAVMILLGRTQYFMPVVKEVVPLGSIQRQSWTVLGLMRSASIDIRPTQGF